MAAKSKGFKSAYTRPKAEGYKGHRAGSRKEIAHKLFDTKGFDALSEVTGMGIKESTARRWFYAFNRQAAPAMKTVSIRELRRVLARLDDVLEREGELLVTRHGRPIARVVPARAARAMPSHASLRAAMQRLSVGSEALVREDRDARP